MTNAQVPPEPPGGDDSPVTDTHETAFVPIAIPVTSETGGIPVPPGAPPGYRGYGVRGASTEVLNEPVVPDEVLDEPVVPTEVVDEPVLPSAPPAADDTAPVAVASQAPTWVLRLPDGQGLQIERTLLVGRNPDPSRGPNDVQLVAVDDPARTVSRSHLVLSPSASGELLIENVSAVNAIVVTGDDGTESKIEAGESFALIGPARLLVGAYPISLEHL